MSEFVIVVLCLFLNAVLAAFEMAFIAIPKAELRYLARAGSKRAKRLLTLRENPERTLSIIQIGVTLVGSLAAAIGGTLASETIAPFLEYRFGMGEGAAESTAVLIIVVPLTYLNVVLGELVPKSLALRSPRTIVLNGSRILFLADRVLAPVVTMLERSTNIILKLFFRRPKEEKLTQTSVEIDSLSPTHQRFVLNMANIEQRKVRDIFLPWEKVSHVLSTDSIETVTQVVFNSGHTRLPVREGDKILGILHTKEFMTLRETGERRWLSIIRPVLTVKPSDSAFGLLRLMQERRSHLSIVYSSRGEPIGIVTLEDIVEEIIGDIFDEDDDGRIRKIFATRAKERSIQPKT